MWARSLCEHGGESSNALNDFCCAKMHLPREVSSFVDVGRVRFVPLASFQMLSMVLRCRTICRARSLLLSIWDALACKRDEKTRLSGERRVKLDRSSGKETDG
jgi:hypothetical protein